MIATRVRGGLGEALGSSVVSFPPRLAPGSPVRRLRWPLTVSGIGSGVATAALDPALQSESSRFSGVSR